MDLLLWVCRGLHLFGAVVWCGGLLYQSGVAFPAARAEEGGDVAALRQNERFVPILWMSASTVLVTGFALMLFDSRFIAFEYRDAWSILLGLKQLTFLLMVVAAFGQARMLAMLRRRVQEEGADRSAAIRAQLARFHRISVALAITAILLAASLR